MSIEKINRAIARHRENGIEPHCLDGPYAVFPDYTQPEHAFRLLEELVEKHGCFPVEHGEQGPAEEIVKAYYHEFVV